jgi:hypothetical protein
MEVAMTREEAICFIGDLVEHYALEYVGSANVEEFNAKVRDAFKLLGVTKEEMGVLTVRPEAFEGT